MMVSPITAFVVISLWKLDCQDSGAIVQNSSVPAYKQMHSFMEAHQDEVYVDSNSEGFGRVKTSDYAYLAESTTIDYTVQRNCELRQVGGLMDSKGYGLATPQGSPWKEHLSNEIIFFQERQDIQKLYTKWWKEKSGGKCFEEKKTKASSLEVENVGGVFVVLIGGTAAGFLIALLEFMWRAFRNSRADKKSFCDEVSDELRFTVRCFGGSKKSLKRSPTKEVMDNGIRFTNLPGFKDEKGQKVIYT